MSTFKVFGPYEIDKEDVFDSEWRFNAWREVESEVPGLSMAKGAYIFSLRNKGDYRPLYVGITHKQGFRKEIFNSSNLLKISKDWRPLRGTLCVHFLAKPKAAHRGFSKNVSAEVLKWLEVMLIFSGRRKNPDLLNKKHMAFLDSVQISHVTDKQKQKGKRPESVRTFMTAIDW